MGVTATAMDGGQPSGFSPSAMHQRLTYGLDGANNRTTTTSQTGNGAPVTATYTRQTSSPQGPSNRCEVWEVLPTDVMPSTATPVPNTPPTDEKYLPIEDESLEGAREAVKLDIPNLPSRLVREHLDREHVPSLLGGMRSLAQFAQAGGGEAFDRVASTAPGRATASGVLAARWRRRTMRAWPRRLRLQPSCPATSRTPRWWAASNGLGAGRASSPCAAASRST
jgi:hypothetical protein